MRRCKRRAFTLVELLVVIGIIATLIAMLLPALNKARQQANNISCMSKLRQIGLAIQQYVASSQGYLPYGSCPYWAPNTNSTVADPLYGNWSYLLTAQILGGTGYESDSAFVSSTASFRANFFADVDTEPVTSPGLQYLCHPRLMPLIDSGNTSMSQGSIDWYLTSLEGGPPYPQYPYYRLSRLRGSANIALIFDGSQDFLYSGGNSDAVASFIDGHMIESGGGYLVASVTTNYFISHFTPGNNVDCMDSTTYGAPPPATECFAGSNFRFRHLNNTSGNFLFCDMHVESRKYTSPTQSEISLTNFLIDPP